VAPARPSCLDVRSTGQTHPGWTRIGRLSTGRRSSPVRVALLSREYPPDVYGGAGVHVEYLAR